jgi:hypothetical protein
VETMRIPLKSVPMSSRWTLAGVRTGWMYYRSRNGMLYAHELATGKWYRIVKLK